MHPLPCARSVCSAKRITTRATPLQRSFARFCPKNSAFPLPGATSNLYSRTPGAFRAGCSDADAYIYIHCLGAAEVNLVCLSSKPRKVILHSFFLVSKGPHGAAAPCGFLCF